MSEKQYHTYHECCYTSNITILSQFSNFPRMFYASLMDRRFQGCFKKVSGVFQGCFEELLREFRGIFKEVLRIIQESFRAVLINFPRCFKNVSKGLQKSFPSQAI